MSQDEELPSLWRPDTVVLVVEMEDTWAQREALRARAYSTEGQREGFISMVPARVRPTTVARLRLYSNDPYLHYPDLDRVVDEAIHDFLVSMGY